MINLDIIVEALEMTDNETEFFFDREKEDTVMFSEYSDDYKQISGMIDEDEDDRFIRLPSQREINEYGMMEEFISSIRNDDQRAALEMAISGRGAFRRFKDTVIRFGIEKKWYAFRDKEYLRVAREWCEENDVAYERSGAGLPDSAVPQPAAASQSNNTNQAEKEAIMAKLAELMNRPDENEDDDDDDDDEDADSDRVLAVMIRMIRVLNKHVSREELDRILGDMEDTLRGE